MMNFKKWLGLGLIIPYCMFFTFKTYAQDGLGQSIQIYTQLRSFTGRPSWLLIIRDLDSGQNIPYLYDFERPDNFWVAFSFGRNYLIEVSTLQFSPYRYNPYGEREIKNFCHLESQGRIIRGQSMYVRLTGDLTPSSRTYTCHVSRYANSNFYTTKIGQD